MIYSCTIFFNEFDLLRIKSEEELSGGVDSFVVVEANKTFQNNPKDTLLLNRKKEFPNISVIVVGDEFECITDSDFTIACFQREAIQRNAGIRGLNIEDDDIIICSDVDEIFLSKDIPLIVEAAKQYGFVKLIQRQFYYKINLLTDRAWHSAFAVMGSFLKSGLTLNRLRNQDGFKIFTNGKHFSYLMTPEQIVEKLKSFSHYWLADPRIANSEKISENIDNYKDLFGRQNIKYFPVIIDETFPKVDLEKWKDFIIPDANLRVDEVPMEDVDLIPKSVANESVHQKINRLPYVELC